MIMNPERKHLVIDEDFKKALHYLENTNETIFLTGRAGTGKSTVINYWREITKKEHVILAPTGRAALNVNGSTIHSFFKLPFGIMDDDTIGDLLYNTVLGLESVQTIVIDEVSMLRCDLVDAINRICRARGSSRTEPFGVFNLYLLVIFFNYRQSSLKTRKNIFLNYTLILFSFQPIYSKNFG